MKKLAVVLLVLSLIGTGCASLIIRPEDTIGVKTVNFITRVVLWAGTLGISEWVMWKVKHEEYLTDLWILATDPRLSPEERKFMRFFFLQEWNRINAQWAAMGQMLAASLNQTAFLLQQQQQSQQEESVHCTSMPFGRSTSVTCDNGMSCMISPFGIGTTIDCN